MHCTHLNLSVLSYKTIVRTNLTVHNPFSWTYLEHYLLSFTNDSIHISASCLSESLSLSTSLLPTSKDYLIFLCVPIIVSFSRYRYCYLSNAWIWHVRRCPNLCAKASTQWNMYIHGSIHLWWAHVSSFSFTTAYNITLCFFGQNCPNDEKSKRAMEYVYTRIKTFMVSSCELFFFHDSI